MSLFLKKTNSILRVAASWSSIKRYAATLFVCIIILTLWWFLSFKQLVTNITKAHEEISELNLIKQELAFVTNQTVEKAPHVNNSPASVLAQISSIVSNSGMTLQRAETKTPIQAKETTQQNPHQITLEVRSKSDSLLSFFKAMSLIRHIQLEKCTIKLTEDSFIDCTIDLTVN